MLGQKVRGQVLDCATAARATRRACAKKLWAALERGAAEARCGRRAATRRSGARRRRTIEFTPLPLFNMQYTNKPSGIHQVMAFGP